MEHNSRLTVDKDYSNRKAMGREESGGNKSTSSKTTFDLLAPTLVTLSEQFGTMKEQFKQLKDVDESLTRFNRAFGAFLFGLSVNGSSVHWPNIPTKLDDDKLLTPQIDQLENQPENPTPITDTDQTNSKEATAVNKISGGRVTKNKIVKKKVNKINIRNIIEHLPLQYREQTEHMKTMETVLRALRQKAEGMNMATMVRMTGLPQYRVMDCLNTLVRSKDVEKTNSKGQPAIYKLDKAKYKIE